MTISTEDREDGPYATNGVTVAFAFAFKVFTSADVKVVYKPTSGAEQTLVLTTNYTVALNADQNANPGGVVTTTGGSSPYNNGTITVTSDIAETQATQLPNAGGWFPKVVENALDKLTIIAQQLRGLIDRGIRQPISDATRLNDLPSAADRAGKFLFFTNTADAQPTAASISATAVVTAAWQAVVGSATLALGRAAMGFSAFFDTLIAGADASSTLALLTTEKFALTGDITPAQITANQNDFNPTGLSTASVLRLSSDASRNITGLAGGPDGRVLLVFNVASNPIVFIKEDAGSTAANRFDFPSSITLYTNQGMLLCYDGPASRWKRVDGSSKPMTTTVLTSGSGTYTTPGGATRLRVRQIGGGAGGAGGGSAPGAGTAGNATTFNTVVANGGTASSGQSGGAGGTGGSGTATFRIPGGYGGGAGGIQTGASGYGGNGVFGGGGPAVSNNNTTQPAAAAVNSGGGGSGGGNVNAAANPSGGGGAGEYAETWITAPAASYSYTVGGTAAGGTAGGSGGTGGTGAAGIIIVEEFYD